MTGILLIGIAIAWLVAAIAITRSVARRFNSLPVKVLGSVVLFPALLVLPMVDELIGKQQFESLCKKYAVQFIDEPHAMNRRVVLMSPRHDQFVEGTVIPIRIQPWTYKDAETDRVLVSFHTLHAKGGWLIRSLGISETSSPLLFHRGCAPKDQFEFAKKFNITVIN